MKILTQKRIHTLSWVTLITAMVICLPLLFGLTETQAAWDGDVANRFSSGTGTEADPYLIRSESHMGYFISQLNEGINFEGSYIKLDADPDMTGHPWTYTSAASFAGTFIGNAHTVKTDCTLLPNIAASGVVTGLNVEAKTTVTRAILCDTNYGLIQMCCVRGDVKDQANTAIAGMICAENNGTVQYCGAVGSVYADGTGRDADAWAALAAKNSGYVQGCYASLTVHANDGSVKYQMSYEDPIANGGGDMVSNNYYDATLYTDITTTGRGFTTAEMKSTAFLNMMAVNVIPGYTWVEGSDGYPAIDTCGTAVVTINGAEGTTSVFHNSSTRYYLTKSVSGGTIYYTLDGSDPRSSSSRRSYTSSGILISSDTVLSAAVYYSSQYGPVMRHTFIQLKGGGTESNPYQITTKQQLNAVRLEPDKCYVLKNNLTYTDTDYALGGVAPGGWVSIPSFSGTFDGDGCSITGLRGSTGGLFDTNQGTIRALRLPAHELYAEYSHGSLANSNYGTITQCYARSAFTAANKPGVTARNAATSTTVGGLVGNNNGTVSYSRVDGMVIANSAWKYGTLRIGGIVGYGGRVESCIFGGTVASYVGNGSDYVYAGGISGEYSSAVNCLNIGSFDFSIATCYQTYIAGIVGGWYNSYAVNSVSRDLVINGSVSTGAQLYEYDFAKSHSGCYKAETARLPTDCPALDFSTVWMITDDGPFPQGVMGADGCCFAFSRWISEPSCTGNGTMEVKCTLCAATDTRTITAWGHNVVTDAAVEPSCTASGKTAGSHCGRCSTVLDAQTDIPRLEHNYVNRICTECLGQIPAIATDKCGDSLSWELCEDGVLIISGSGTMWDRDESAAPLWYAYRDFVKEVILPEALSSIGAEAFRGCTALTQITLPQNILTIGENAFADCTALSIVGYTGTAAHAYANANAIPFISLSTHAESPHIASAPASAEYIHGESAAPLTVTASVSDGGVITYQWYVSDTADGNGTPIDGAAEASYIPPTDDIGTKYYYAVITNTNTDATDSQSASVRTDSVSVTVHASTYTISGKITSVGEEAITVELLAGDAAVEGITITVTEDSCTITNVPAGTYTLRISKPRHVPREYTVTVGGN